jgi:hypothetical protein
LIYKEKKTTTTKTKQPRAKTRRGSWKRALVALPDEPNPELPHPGNTEINKTKQKQKQNCFSQPLFDTFSRCLTNVSFGGYKVKTTNEIIFRQRNKQTSSVNRVLENCLSGAQVGHSHSSGAGDFKRLVVRAVLFRLFKKQQINIQTKQTKQ